MSEKCNIKMVMKSRYLAFDKIATYMMCTATLFFEINCRLAGKRG
jgi:hypothetical protein